MWHLIYIKLWFKNLFASDFLCHRTLEHFNSLDFVCMYMIMCKCDRSREVLEYGAQVCVFVFIMVKTIICCLTTNLLHPEENLDSAHWNRTNTEQHHPNPEKMPTQMQHANDRHISRWTWHTSAANVHRDYIAFCVQLTGVRERLECLFSKWLISEKVPFYVYMYQIPVSISMLENEWWTLWPAGRFDRNQPNANECQIERCMKYCGENIHHSNLSNKNRSMNQKWQFDWMKMQQFDSSEKISFFRNFFQVSSLIWYSFIRRLIDLMINSIEMWIFFIKKSKRNSAFSWKIIRIERSERKKSLIKIGFDVNFSFTHFNKCECDENYECNRISSNEWIAHSRENKKKKISTKIKFASHTESFTTKSKNDYVLTVHSPIFSKFWKENLRIEVPITKELFFHSHTKTDTEFYCWNSMPSTEK